MSLCQVDEVCFLCGIAPDGPSEFTSDPQLAAADLTDALLKNFPHILSAASTWKTRGDLEAYFEAMFGKLEADDFGKAFYDCIAIGYFDEEGDPPRKEVDDDLVQCYFPDGLLVEKRWVGEPYCGSFTRVYTMEAEGEVAESEDISNTEATHSFGFGNFFLSKCCYKFLKGWIKRAALPTMWDGRELSFIGEIWEIMNSRRTGRDYLGYVEWLQPGGVVYKRENKALGCLASYHKDIYPVKTAAALQSGCDQDRIMQAIYHDYRYWVFASPHQWPGAPAHKDLVEVNALGFDVLPQPSSPIGCLSCLATEILDQIFRYLPNIPTYLNLKLVSKRMNNLVSDTKFSLPILREIIRLNPTGDMFWIYPLKHQPLEMDNFKNCLYSWFTRKCSSVEKESVTARDILFHPEFPLIEFIHSLYTSDCSRNRRRLWKNVKRFEEVWVDYRKNGWEVNRFGVPYPEEE